LLDFLRLVFLQNKLGNVGMELLLLENGVDLVVHGDFHVHKLEVLYFLAEVDIRVDLVLVLKYISEELASGHSAHTVEVHFGP